MEINKNSASQIVINDAQAGQRIDNFLVKHLKGVPRSHIYRLLRSGQVRVNRGRKKPGYRLQAGDLVGEGEQGTACLQGEDGHPEAHPAEHAHDFWTAIMEAGEQHGGGGHQGREQAAHGHGDADQVIDPGTP